MRSCGEHTGVVSPPNGRPPLSVRRRGRSDVEQPVSRRLKTQRSAGLDAVCVHAHDIAWGEESLGRGKPQYPVAYAGIEPGGATLESVCIAFAYAEREPGIVAEAVLGTQLGVASGKKIHVVERWIAIVS